MGRVDDETPDAIRNSLRERRATLNWERFRDDVHFRVLLPLRREDRQRLRRTMEAGRAFRLKFQQSQAAEAEAIARSTYAPGGEGRKDDLVKFELDHAEMLVERACSR